MGGSTAIPRSATVVRMPRGGDRPLDPPPRARPARLTAQVCLLCGSTSTTVPEPDCAHGRTVRLAAITPEIADLVGRIRRARHGIAAALATLHDLADLERLAGRALVDDEPDVVAMGNLVHLRPRWEIDPRYPSRRPAPSPIVPDRDPPKRLPVTPPGGLVLQPQSASGSKRSRAARLPPPPRRPAPADGSRDLFDAPDPPPGPGRCS
jgi:hypothetical protein